MTIWKNTKVRTPFGTTANFNRMRMGQPIYYDGTDYFMLDINKPNSSPESVIHLPRFHEDWDNEELIRDFIDDVLHMLHYYKKPEARDELPGEKLDYDELVKTLFIDRVKEAAETMGIRMESFDDPIDVDESKPVTTTHELARRMTLWPKNTTVFIDREFDKDSYQWHFPIAYTPTASELESYCKTGADTFTSIKMDDEIQGF